MISPPHVPLRKALRLTTLPRSSPEIADRSTRRVLSWFTPGQARGWDCEARSFPQRGNSLRLSLRSSLASLEKPCPLRLRRAFSPKPLACSPQFSNGGLMGPKFNTGRVRVEAWGWDSEARSFPQRGNSLRLSLCSSLASLEKPCPLRLRRAFSPKPLACSPWHQTLGSAFRDAIGGLFFIY